MAARGNDDVNAEGLQANRPEGGRPRHRRPRRAVEMARRRASRGRLHPEQQAPQVHPAAAEPGPRRHPARRTGHDPPAVVAAGRDPLHDRHRRSTPTSSIPTCRTRRACGASARTASSDTSAASSRPSATRRSRSRSATSCRRRTSCPSTARSWAPSSRTTVTDVHLHGGFVPWTSDGGPFAWWDPDGHKGPSFLNNSVLGVPRPRRNEAEYYYPNDQGARLVWYHDHSLGHDPAERVRGHRVRVRDLRRLRAVAGQPRPPAGTRSIRGRCTSCSRTSASSPGTSRRWTRHGRCRARGRETCGTSTSTTPTGGTSGRRRPARRPIRRACRSSSPTPCW